MSVVWLNGALLAGAEARIDPADRGFTLGDGVFETLRVDAGVPLHASRHFARLRTSAGMLGIPIIFADSAIRTAMDDVLAANGMTEAALRLTLSRGAAARGLLPPVATTPTMLIGVGPLPAPLGPARLIIAQCTRRNEFSPLSRIKSLNYLDNVLARQEAAAAGADDALLLNTRGDVAEATAANLFVLVGGRWVTPPVADGALPGIARELLLQAGLAEECRISMADLRDAEVAFLCNSLGMRVVQSIGELALDAKHPAIEERRKVFLF